VDVRALWRHVAARKLRCIFLPYVEVQREEFDR
jgi:hypothetical protein